MALTGKEEGIVKAELAVKIAKDKLHKHRLLVDDEIRLQHKPITDALLATHKTTADSLRQDVTDAETALKNELA